MIEAKHYSWEEVEQYILKKVKENNFYSDVASKKEAYSIIMPPPNVTGYLHMGHALVTTLQDVLVRYKRMKGFDVLWQPGVDHAGIATQVVVEKQLAEKGIKRQDLGREGFLEKVYEWKDHSAGRIIEQIKRMGSSCDFSYLAFTMDEQSIKGVNKAFVELYNAGLIYQDDRLVNWDWKLQTAISDLEVELKEVKSKMYYLKYYIEGSDDYLVIATTRPETLFGDTAVAVNGDDERYKGVIGKLVRVPLVKRTVKIIADSYISYDKGSGAMKVTPGHDLNDFEIGKRHNLETINILNKDGTLNANVPEEFIGLNIQEARKLILQRLEEFDLIERIEDYQTSLPYGDRSGVVIEPMLTKQWFINAGELAKQAINVVKDGKIEFVPKNWENLYFDWMENIKPWCISRQLWWGHRIPVYYGPDNKIFVAQTKEIAHEEAKNFYGKDVFLSQDEDVLDTWFSSGLWPFLTMGWPDNTEKLKKYYPSDVLVTAFDIIFFWVARMIMLGTFLMKEVPFKKVYIHALIRDEKGQKMSKSKGNVIDPLQIIEKYGTDALRFSLVAYSAQGRDIKLSEKTIEGYRNFVTKIWNSFKFCSQNEMVFDAGFNPQTAELEINKWILHKVQSLATNLDGAFNEHRFNEIATGIYQFIWGDFCDLYVEFSKAILYNKEENEENKQEVRKTLGFVFDRLLKIINPVMPFISEFLYEELHKDKTQILALQNYPSDDYKIHNKAVENIEKLVDFIARVRRLRVDLNISPAAFLNVFFQGQNADFIAKNLEIAKKVARLEKIEFVLTIDKNMVQDVVHGEIFGVPLSGVIDIEKERQRLQKNEAKLLEELQKVAEKLNNKAFMEKAQPNVVETFMEQKAEINDKLTKVKEILAKINI
jgi:valyl-tRNA synthetase